MAEGRKCSWRFRRVGLIFLGALFTPMTYLFTRVASGPFLQIFDSTEIGGEILFLLQRAKSWA